MLSGSKHRSGLLALAAAATLLAAAHGAASASSTAKPRWKPIPVKVNGIAGFFREFGWASGRIWFGVEGSVPQPTGTCTTCAIQVGIVWSAKIVNGALTSFVSSRVTDDQLGQSSFVGSSLVELDDAAPLLASGKVGAWAPIAGTPAQTTHDQLFPNGPGLQASGSVTVGGRTIWAVAGTGMLAACCTAAGQPVDLSSITSSRLKLNQTSVRLGLDSKGRVWLAWSELLQGPFVTVHLAELDPATLTARSSKSYGPVANGAGGGSQVEDDFTMACGDSCRLLFGTLAGIQSWGGDGPPTKLVGGIRSGFVFLAAGYVGHKLALVTAKGSSDYGWHLSLGEGGPTGAGFHGVVLTDVAQANPHPNESWNAYAMRAIQTPTGFVVLAGYPPSGRTLQPLEATVLRG
ncbi:MAG TPA: hypothetical protein VEH79_02230 [Gaiellaceae bacterium]|nr:hypothetical protein [Gaiellaceae bacterium]